MFQKEAHSPGIISTSLYHAGVPQSPKTSVRGTQSPSFIKYKALTHNSPPLVTKEPILSETSTKFLCIWVFCLHVYLCVYVTGTHRGWNGVVDPGVN